MPRRWHESMNPGPDKWKILGWERGKSLYRVISPLAGGVGGPEQASASPRYLDLTILTMSHLDRSISFTCRLLTGLRRVAACLMWPSCRYKVLARESSKARRRSLRAFEDTSGSPRTWAAP